MGSRLAKNKSIISFAIRDIDEVRLIAVCHERGIKKSEYIREALIKQLNRDVKTKS